MPALAWRRGSVGLIARAPQLLKERRGPCRAQPTSLPSSGPAPVPACAASPRAAHADDAICSASGARLCRKRAPAPAEGLTSAELVLRACLLLCRENARRARVSQLAVADPPVSSISALPLRCGMAPHPSAGPPLQYSSEVTCCVARLACNWMVDRAGVLAGQVLGEFYRLEAAVKVLRAGLTNPWR